MSIFIGAILGYLIGCFQTSFILGKLFKHIDIRKYGSGNAGSTNAFRVMGAKYGILTFIGDAGKSILAYSLSMYFTNNDVITSFIVGFFVVIGHDWPIFLKFKGGKGIASTIGLIFAYDYRVGLVLLIIAIIIGYIFKYVSVSSMILTALFPIALLILKEDMILVAIATILFLIAVYRHRSNIKRILNGKEPKIKVGSNKNGGK